MNVPHDRALTILEECARDASALVVASTPFSDEIDQIVLGNHLTFRYMLVTALLAKATSAEVNPLSLQAGSPLVGAFDARSLCHKVIVPNQGRLLRYALGNSNEPFLNKPARFPSIDPSNAVRRGNDAKLLATLHSLLGRMASSPEARHALVYCIHALWARQDRTRGEFTLAAAGATGNRHRVARYLEALVSRPELGETSVLACGIVIHLLSEVLSNSWEIMVHPTNISGASSLQVGDIDVRVGKTLALVVEVKDKPYLASDVTHATTKARAAGASTSLFVLGRRALRIDGGAPPDAIAWSDDSEAFVVGLDALVASIIPFIDPHINLSHVCALTVRVVDGMRVRDETLRHVSAVMREFGNG